MMNAKVKVPSGASSKQKIGNNLPITGQGLKIGGQNSQGLGVNSAQLSGGQTQGNMQHPSHAKKLTEGKLTGSKAGLGGQHKYNNSQGGPQQQAAINLHVDMAKKTAFELSRNQIGSRGRSLGGGQSPNGTAPRRNIQTFQQHQETPQGMLGVQQSQFDTPAIIPNATSPQQQLLIANATNSTKNQRNNTRANSTMPGRPPNQQAQQQSSFAPVSSQFNYEHKGPTGQIKNNKYMNNASFSQANSPLGTQQLPGQNIVAQANNSAINGPSGVNSGNIQSQSQAIKRIRDSRQRGNKSMVAPSDPQNQLMQAYINQTVTLNQKNPDFAGPNGAIRATEPIRIRAHSDLKKTGIQIGVKIHGIQNSREHLNQTTVLAGNPQNTHLSQGIQQFHSRGNSITGTNIGIGFPGQNQKRSQSVDKNAPHFHQFNQSQSFAQSAHFGNGQQDATPGVNQSQPVPGTSGTNTSKNAADPKNTSHFIHEAIERKIERFSRQRNRGAGMHMSQGTPQTSVQNPTAIYNQNLTGQLQNSNALNKAGSKAQIQGNQNNPSQPASRAFKAQQKAMQNSQQNVQTVQQSQPQNPNGGGQMSEEQQIIFERQKKKNQSQPGTANGQGQMLMRGEIMSAGQTQQRKILTANQAIQPNETNMADEPTGTRNNYLNNVLDGYQGNASKKVVQRAGTRGVNSSTTNQGQFDHSVIQGIPTGPLLAQKVVQLPKQQQRTGGQQVSSTENEEQKMFRNGKIKLDRLKREPDSPSKNKGNLTIIEVDRSPEKGDTRNKTKIAAAIQIQRARQQQSEDKKQTQNPQLQGSQGQQTHTQKQRKEKIAVISLTTAKIDVRDPTAHDIHSEKQTMEPDEQAQLQGSRKRLIGLNQHLSPESPRSQPNEDYDQYSMRQARDGRKRKHANGGQHSHRAGSNGSVQVSMRDESIMQMSVNSVTDGNFIHMHENGDAQSHDSNDHFSIKKQMIRYLSRVADRNKPLFVFNQKLNLGGDSSDDDTGTPSFSLVALIEK